jgi:hypothetical protein
MKRNGEGSMELEEARKIVTEYQKWRISEAPAAYSNLTQAIDTLLAATTVTDDMVERAYEVIFYYSGFSNVLTKTTVKTALQAALGGGK